MDVASIPITRRSTPPWKRKSNDWSTSFPETKTITERRSHLANHRTSSPFNLIATHASVGVGALVSRDDLGGIASVSYLAARTDREAKGTASTLADTLMTVCTYDDRSTAERDCATLRAQGVRAVVAECRLEDPDRPGEALHDLVVFDSQLEQAQAILGLFPPDPTEPLDPASFQKAQRAARWGLFLFGAVVITMVAIGLISLAFGRLR